jgi:hypothetical protein
MSIETPHGVKLGSAFSSPPQTVRVGVETEIVVRMPDPPLAPGTYVLGIAIGVGAGTGNFLDMLGNVMEFDIAPTVNRDGGVEAWDESWGQIAFPLATVEARTGPSTATADDGGPSPSVPSADPATN